MTTRVKGTALIPTPEALEALDAAAAALVSATTQATNAATSATNAATSASAAATSAASAQSASASAALAAAYADAAAATIATSALPILPFEAKIALLGNSFTAYGITEVSSPPTRRSNGRGYAKWLYNEMEGRMVVPPGCNFGVGGDTTALVKARLASVMTTAKAQGVQGWFLEIGTNDVYAGLTATQITQGIIDIAQVLLSLGGPVWLATITPRFEPFPLTSGQEAVRQQVNANLRSLTTPGLVVINAETFLTDAASVEDGLHPNAEIGAPAYAAGVAAVMKRSFGNGSPVPGLAYQATSIYTGNPAMAGGTTTPTSWAINTSLAGGATVTPSKVVDPVTGRAGWRIAISGSYSGSAPSIQLDQSFTSPLPSQGDLLETLIEYEVGPNVGALNSVDYGAVVLDSGSNVLSVCSTCVQPASTFAFPPRYAGKRLIDRSPVQAIGMGTPSVVYNLIAINLKQALAPTPIDLVITVWGAGVRIAPGLTPSLPVSSATFNLARSAPDTLLTFTNGDLTIERIGTGGTWATAIASCASTTGKRFFSWKVDATSDAAIGSGLCDATYVYTDGIPGFVSHSLMNAGFATFYPGSLTGKTTSPGSVLDWAVNLDARRAYLRLNGGAWAGPSGAADPVAGTGGYDLSSIFSVGAAISPLASISSTGSKGTINVGGTPYTYAVPAGYTHFGA